MPPRKNQIFIICIFLLFVFLPLIFSDFNGGKYSAAEKRTLATFPKVFTANLGIASGIKTYGEKWLDDNIGFRSLIKNFQTKLDYGFFHVSPSSKVIIGEEDWFYYTRDENLAIGLGTFPLPDDQLLKIKIKQALVQSELIKNETNYVVAFVPSKVSVYPEDIGGSSKDSVTLIDNVTEFLKEKTTIPVINLKPELVKAKEKEVVYFKQDTHWNDVGLYISYLQLQNFLVGKGYCENHSVDINEKTGNHTGDLSRLMGLVDVLLPEDYSEVFIVSSSAQEVDSGDKFTKFYELTDKYYGNVTRFMYQNSSVEPNVALIYGDSFSRPLLIELLAENFSELFFVSSLDININYVDILKPDIVILEISERLFDQLWK